jgi:lysine/ornithine N-monooxygenase
MNTRQNEIVVIGAGPYGLAAAAQLRAAGASVRAIGRPMSFWKENMPKGMWLRSPWSASHIGHPRSPLSLDEYERTRGTRLARPVPLSDFVAYGQWFQQRTVPDVDERRVDRVDALRPGFRVHFEDGDQIECGRVIVAAGIANFAWTPPLFEGVPQDLARHSSAHADLTRFRNARVAVIGGGQSAFESAVLLHEAGANVELLMRGPAIHWVGRATRKGMLGRVMFDRTDVGPAFMSHLIARPRFLREFPRSFQREAMRRALAPGASLWLRPRSAGMRVTTGRQVTAVAPSEGRLLLTLDDGSVREVDHAVLATGYRVELRRLAFLPASLLAQIRSVESHPVLGPGLESSVPGLHFLGAPAAYSFGPLVRFVAGTHFASTALTRSIVGTRRRGTMRAPDALGQAVLAGSPIKRGAESLE